MKPTPRLDFPTFNVIRPLEDDEVDRSEMEVQRCIELTDTNRSKVYSRERTQRLEERVIGL